MSITEHKHMSKDEVVRARRIEVFTGTGRRRSWTAVEKAAILAESFAPNATVSQVARNHGLTPSQLFAWRRAVGRERGDLDALAFAPAVVETGSVSAATHVIELDIGGDSVWIWRDADATVVTAVIGALKKTRSSLA